MNESPRINDILQRLTVKVEARLRGAGIICKFSETAKQVFILTAKHNLCGTEFCDAPNWEDILISFLWDTQLSPPQYCGYKLQSSDQIICSEDEEDIAILVVNCSDIENLVGKLPVVQLTDNPESFRNIIFEGFPEAYYGESPIRMYGNLIQLGKPKPYTIEVEVPTDLVTKWFISDIEEQRTALDNSEGFSGSGLFVKANDDIFLLGVVLRLGRFNRFFCVNVKQIKTLLEQAALPQPIFHAIGLPFTSKQVLTLDQFVKEYENSKLATPLSNLFFGREKELKNLLNSVSNHKITIVTGTGGVGKTRLCREVITLFEQKHPDFTTYCIRNKFDSIYSDLRLIFDSDKNYLIFIDDANRQSVHLQQILSIMQEPRLGQICLIITVRNYAYDIIKTACLAYSQTTIDIEKMTDEAITTILGSNDFGIKNADYLKKILTIADGNPRLAIMAAKVALERQSIETLNDVSDIFELYFSTYLHDHKELNDPNMRKTLGLIGFFHVIDFDNEIFCKSLLEQFNLNFNVFKANINLLENLELVEFSEDKNTVRIAEQNLGNYFFFCCFIRDGLLSFETLLLKYFKSHKNRFTEGVVSANNHFGGELVQTKLTPTIRKYLSENKHRGTTETVKFLELFWFYLSDETLEFIADEIENIPIPQSFEFKAECKNHTYWSKDENQFIELLHSFLKYPITTHFEVAVELGFDNVRREPELMPHWIKILRDTIPFDCEDARIDFFRQTKLFEVLIRNAKEGKPEYVFAFFPLAAFFLHTEYDIHKGERGHKVSFYHYQIPFIETIKTFRAGIWHFISDNYPMNSIVVDDLLSKYCHSFSPKNNLFVAFDLVYMLPFIRQRLNHNNVKHCLLVHQYSYAITQFAQIEVPELTTLKAEFKNQQFEWLRILDKSKYRNENWYDDKDIEENYDTFLKLKQEEIQSYFEFSNLAEFELFYQTYLGFADSNSLPLNNLTWSLDIILTKHWEKDADLCLSFIQSMIQADKVHYYVPYQVFIATFNNLQEIITLYQTIYEHKFKEKDHWLLQFFNLLPMELVNHHFCEGFMHLLKNLETPLVFYAQMLEKFLLFNPNIYSDWLKIIITKNENGIRIQLLHSFFEQYLNRFSNGDLFFIKQAYFQQISNQDYFDLGNKDFMAILKRDNSFLEDFIRFEHRGGNAFKRGDEHGHLGTIWELENAENLIENGIILSSSLTSYSKFHPVVLFNGVKPECKERVKLFLMNFMAKYHSKQIEFIQTIVNIIKNEYKDSYEIVFKHFLNYNQNLNDFKKINWHVRTHYLKGALSNNSSEMGAYELKQILKWVGEMSNPAKYIRHKSYLREQISSEEYYAKLARRRNFSSDDF